MNRLLLATLSALLLLTGCNALKTIKAMKSGDVEQASFNVKIPFEYRLGLVILKVEIAGKAYDFVLDTGAPNVVFKKKLAQQLVLDNVAEQKVGDSQGEDSNLGITSLEKVTIGGINFLNTGAAVADLKLSKEVGYLNIDGFIGSNLMRKAIWKFDYQNQTITITDSPESLRIPETAAKLPFATEITGTPIIDVNLNGVVERNVIVDLGSNGDFTLSKKSYDAVMKKAPLTPHTYSYGVSSSGLYGEGKADSTHYAKVASTSLGDISLNNAVVTFGDNSSSYVGNQFFRNYDLIIDWFSKEISLIRKAEYDYSSSLTFGFSYSNQDGRLVVSSIYEGKDDLKIGDQIMSIDGVRYNQLTAEQWCELIENKVSSPQDETTVTISGDGEELTFVFKKFELL